MARNSNLSVSTDVAKRLDITCRKGDTFELVVKATDANGDPIDFAGFTDMQIDVRPTDEDAGTPILEFTHPTDFDTGTMGQVTIIKDAAAMAAVTAGLYVYDLEIADASGKVTTWFYGKFTINDDVSI